MQTCTTQRAGLTGLSLKEPGEKLFYGVRRRISLFLRSPGKHFRRMPQGQRIDGQLQARYWSHGAYNFALVSAADDGRGVGIGEALRTTL